jgi:peptidyl-prolyl cis-trans isomerase B (cyclophilin B)
MDAGNAGQKGEITYEVKDEKNPIVTMTMENGDVIVIELYPDNAPNTVNNFISLINSGYYDGLIFHRIDPTFMIQGGDPLGTGGGGPGYSIYGEFEANGFINNLSHDRGVISMARRSMPLDSAGSQFFITIRNYPSLDGQYAAFGVVVYGIDAVDTIANQPRDGERPRTEQKIQTMTVDTKGIEYPEPEKTIE